MESSILPQNNAQNDKNDSENLDLEMGKSRLSKVGSIAERRSSTARPLSVVFDIAPEHVAIKSSESETNEFDLEAIKSSRLSKVGSVMEEKVFIF